MNARLAAITPEQLHQAGQAIAALKHGPRALRLALEICARCGICASQCQISMVSPLSRVNPARRSQEVRDVYAGKRRLTRAMLAGWVRDFYECTTCRRCAVYCPLGIDNSIITRKVRSILGDLGLTPCRITDTQAASDKRGNNEGATESAIRDMVQFLESELKEEHGIPIRIPLDEKGADVLFATASSEIMGRPENLMGCATFFHAAGISWTMSTQAFDAANFGLFSGDDAHMLRKNTRLHEACLDLGVTRLVIGECGHAYRVAKHMGGATSRPGLPYAVTDIFSVAVDVLRRGGLRLDPSRNEARIVTYHDPCNFGRSGGIMEQPREVLRACVPHFRELSPNRERNYCCGGGGGLSVLESAEGIDRESTMYEFRMKVSGRKKYEQIAASGANYVVAPCFNCLRQIEQLMDYYNLDVSVGTVFELFDLAVLL